MNDWPRVVAVDNGTDGTGTNVKLIHTVGENGGFIGQLIMSPISTSGSTTTSPAMARFYINNGLSVSDAGNNLLIKELLLSSIYVDESQMGMRSEYMLPLNFNLRANYRIYCGISAMSDNTQWEIRTFSNNYL